MERDRQRWNARFAEAGFIMGENPTKFVAEMLPLILEHAPGRRALDIACGEGRHSIFLARHGFSVTGIDISEVALAKGEEWRRREGLDVTFLCRDLDDLELPGIFDLVLNVNFLVRELLEAEIRALAPGGLLLVDTLREGEGAPPVTDPSYLLRKGELREILGRFPGDFLRYEEPEGNPPTARALFKAVLKSTGC